MIYKIDKKGFTLIETFVAITILLIVAIGPLAMLARSIGDGMFVQNQVTASFLAQECLDLAQNKRDSNIAESSEGGNIYEDGEGAAFDGFHAESCDIEDTTCSIDVMGGKIEINSGSDIKLYRTAKGAFTHQANTDGVANAVTVFSRKIWVKPIDYCNNGKDAEGKCTIAYSGKRVRCDVTWSNKGIPRSLYLTTLLYR